MIDTTGDVILKQFDSNSNARISYWPPIFDSIADSHGTSGPAPHRGLLLLLSGDRIFDWRERRLVAAYSDSHLSSFLFNYARPWVSDLDQRRPS